MRLSLSRLLICLFCALFASRSVYAEESVSGDHVQVRWLAPEVFDRNRTDMQLALHFAVDPGWHVYWINAGDSGAAPRFTFSSEQLVAGDVTWPYPHRLPVAHLTNLGYEGNTAYIVPVQWRSRDAEQVVLTAELEWLVCQEECIPGFGTLTLDRPVGDAEQWNPDDQHLLASFAGQLPMPGAQAPFTIAEAKFQTDAAQLDVTLNTTEKVDIYPLGGNFLTAAAPEVFTEENGSRFRFNTLPGAAIPAQTGFVVVADGTAWEFAQIPVRQTLPPQAETVGLPWLLLLAFAGGVILNLMPCVFPVLSIKAFRLVQSARSARVHEGLLYSAGVITTFALLGGLFLALRSAGVAVGWGFQLQSPAVVLGLILLFWLMALSFLGVFEFGHRIMRLAGGGGSRSAFMTGVLAVFVAAPCTGPFMGAALGASVTLPAAAALGIFLALGAGLATPFLLLALVPGLARRLPRPGPWMETLRQFLAFPLFASALWLLWVLDQLSGDSAWLTAAIVVLLITFAIWLGQSARRSLKIAAWTLAIASIAVALPRLQPQTETPVARAGWQAFDANLVERARQQGQAVFIDFTAAWCITCQVNKKLVLDTATSDRLFQEHRVLRLRADWTRYDPAITRALEELGRNSVPVYLFYPAGGGAARVLPQILTQDTINALFTD